MERTIQESTLRKLTLTASLAAVYTVFRAIPISKLIGTTGNITAAGMIAPIIGIMLEPAYGITSVFTGTMIASLVPGNPITFSGLGFAPGALNVAMVSLAVRNRRVEASMMFLIVLGLFVINPYTRFFVGAGEFSPPIPYLWMHFAAFLVLISPLSTNLRVNLTASKYRDVLIAVLVLAFTGTMIEHATGGILYAAIVGKGAVASWPAIFLVYPFERLVLVIGATLICVPLVRLLRHSLLEDSFISTKSAVVMKAVRSLESKED